MGPIRICFESNDFRVDLGAASEGVIASFEDQRARTLTDYQTIPISIKWSRRSFGVIIRRARRIKSIEDGSFGGT
jgi:hypothetical protein